MDENDDRDGREDDDRPNGDRGGGLSFSLPPIELPPMFPRDLRLEFPVPVVDRTVDVTALRLVVAALAFDVADAALAVAATPPAVDWMRTVAGLGLALAFAWPVGVAYGWEIVAVATGAGWLTVAPTLVVLVASGVAR